MALFYPYGCKMVHIQNVPAILMLQLVSPKIQTPGPHMGARALQRAPAIRYCKPPSVKGIRTYQGRENGSFMVQKLGISKFIRIISMKFLHLRPWKGQIMWFELVLMERSLESAVFFTQRNGLKPPFHYWPSGEHALTWRPFICLLAMQQKRLLMSELIMKQSGWLISIVLPD